MILMQIVIVLYQMALQQQGGGKQRWRDDQEGQEAPVTGSVLRCSGSGGEAVWVSAAQIRQWSVFHGLV